MNRCGGGEGGCGRLVRWQSGRGIGQRERERERKRGREGERMREKERARVWREGGGREIKVYCRSLN